MPPLPRRFARGTFLLLAGTVVAGACSGSSDPSQSNAVSQAASGTFSVSSSGPGSTGTSTGSSATSGAGGEGGATSSGSGGTGGQGAGGGASCSEDPCKLTAPQCGCNANQMCVLASGQPACVTAGSVGEGQACGLCSAGLQCLQFFDAGPATCHAFCDGDGDCEGPGARCALQIGDGAGGVYPPRLCSVACDPLTSAGCPLAGTKCEVLPHPDHPTEWLTLCIPHASTPQSQPCVETDECARGLGCFEVEANNSVCLTYCNLASPSCATCIPFDPPMQIGTMEYGACL